MPILPFKPHIMYGKLNTNLLFYSSVLSSPHVVVNLPAAEI